MAYRSRSFFYILPVSFFSLLGHSVLAQNIINQTHNETSVPLTTFSFKPKGVLLNAKITHVQRPFTHPRRKRGYTPSVARYGNFCEAGYHWFQTKKVLEPRRHRALDGFSGSAHASPNRIDDTALEATRRRDEASAVKGR
jgi:hypothetical protein